MTPVVDSWNRPETNGGNGSAPSAATHDSSVSHTGGHQLVSGDGRPPRGHRRFILQQPVSSSAGQKRPRNGQVPAAQATGAGTRVAASALKASNPCASADPIVSCTPNLPGADHDYGLAASNDTVAPPAFAAVCPKNTVDAGMQVDNVVVASSGNMSNTSANVPIGVACGGCCGGVPHGQPIGAVLRVPGSIVAHCDGPRSHNNNVEAICGTSSSATSLGPAHGFGAGGSLSVFASVGAASTNASMNQNQAHAAGVGGLVGSGVKRRVSAGSINICANGGAQGTFHRSATFSGVDQPGMGSVNAAILPGSTATINQCPQSTSTGRGALDSSSSVKHGGGVVGGAHVGGAIVADDRVGSGSSGGTKLASAPAVVATSSEPSIVGQGGKAAVAIRGGDSAITTARCTGRSGARELLDRLKARGLAIVMASGAEDAASPDISWVSSHLTTSAQPSTVLQSPSSPPSPLCFSLVVSEDVMSQGVAEATLRRICCEAMRHAGDFAYVLALLSVEEVVTLQRNLLGIMGMGCAPTIVPCRDADHAAQVVLEVGRRRAAQERWPGLAEPVVEVSRRASGPEGFVETALAAISGISKARKEEILRASGGSLRTLAVAAAGAAAAAADGSKLSREEASLADFFCAWAA
eukprot:TRINITY_DN55652_c0_g1_i1.p1 TRINITY_DN55652_c0_g1~~TRINITY_DN55652_c0_g1_i1.p1  ORF type:complete len:639 (-),score=116.54 TRINITY_DN55652_c0_g1_i1:220-2136(-)